MMTARSSHILASVLIASTALLSACASQDPVYTAFNREAGSLLDTGTFGNATMNNTQIMHAVVNFLATQGIGKNRLEAVASFGEDQPLIVTEGRERRNRRTVTEVSGFVSGHPMVMDGKYAQIIYREYVASATIAPTISRGAQTGATQ